MPQYWKTYKLDQLMEIGSSKRIFMADYVKQGVPFYRSKEVIQKHKKADITTELFITQQRFDEIRNKFGAPKAQDILLTSVGTIGVPFLIPENYEDFYFKDGNLTWFKNYNLSLIHPAFLYFVFDSEFGRKKFNDVLIGSTQQALTISSLRGIEIDLPPLPEQKSIASILSALDDKIENNLAMNKTLEEMAMALYKHWFVDFGPFQEDEFVPSELGDIPKGWEVKTLGLLALNKRANKVANAIDENDQYVGLEHLERNSLSIVSSGNGSDVSSNKSKFESGDILFGKLRPYFKKVGVAPFDGVCSTDILVINPRNHDYFGFVLFTIFNDAFIDYTTTVSGGTRMPRVSWGDIANYKVAVPSEVNLIGRFDQIVRSHVSQQIANVLELQCLTQLRDTLLPKLISGEVRVKDAEQTVANAL